MEITVISPTPFSLPAVVNSHGWVMLAPFQQGDDGSFSYVARLNNGRVLQYSAFPLDGGVCISSPEELNAGEEAELAQQVRWMVGLEQDVSGFYELVRDHPKRLPVRLNEEDRIAVVVPRPEDLTPADTSSYLVPAHCTGWRATHTIAARLPDAFIQNSVGTIYDL